MTLTVFTTLLVVIASLASLFTEGIKNTFKVKSPNITAIVISAILAILASVTYAVNQEIAFTIQYGLITLWLIILSALCSMVGYDKVIQVIKQIGG